MEGSRAVILAGGKGTRLKPYTVALPKPLVPIGDYPILEIIIRQLGFFGFKSITIAVNHQAEIIKSYFGDGNRLGVDIDYSLESKPLSTIAPLSLIENLPEDFLILNGDILSDADYGEFFCDHVKARRLFSVLAHERRDIVDYGVLDVNTDMVLTGFREKPVNKYLVSMGVYAANRRILKYIPRNERFGFDDLMYKLLSSEERVYVHNYEGYWMDIGRPDDYMNASEDFGRLKGHFLREKGDGGG